MTGAIKILGSGVGILFCLVMICSSMEGVGRDNSPGVIKWRMLSLHRPLDLAEGSVCFQSGSSFPATITGMGLSLG